MARVFPRLVAPGGKPRARNVFNLRLNVFTECPRPPPALGPRSGSVGPSPRVGLQTSTSPGAQRKEHRAPFCSAFKAFGTNVVSTSQQIARFVPRLCWTFKTRLYRRRAASWLLIQYVTLISVFMLDSLSITKSRLILLQHEKSPYSCFNLFYFSVKTSLTFLFLHNNTLLNPLTCNPPFHLLILIFHTDTNTLIQLSIIGALFKPENLMQPCVSFISFAFMGQIKVLISCIQVLLLLFQSSLTHPLLCLTSLVHADIYNYTNIVLINIPQASW